MTGYDNGIIRNNSNERKITYKLLKAGLRDPGDTSQAHFGLFYRLGARNHLGNLSIDYKQRGEFLIHVIIIIWVYIFFLKVCVII
jgi:hypothetical protein